MQAWRRVLASLMIVGVAASAAAQEPVLGGDEQPALPPASWASRCVSDARQGVAECSMIQRAVMQNSGQVVGSVSLRFPAQGDPVIFITVPLGLSVQGGVTYDVDGANPQQLPIDTCDRNGCYASASLSADTIRAMQAGQRLNVVFQSRNRQPVTLPMSLAGFTAAYDKTKP